MPVTCISSNENKKPKVHFIIENIFGRNECKISIGHLTVLHSFSIKNIFYDK